MAGNLTVTPYNDSISKEIKILFHIEGSIQMMYCVDEKLNS